MKPSSSYCVRRRWEGASSGILSKEPCGFECVILGDRESTAQTREIKMHQHRPGSSLCCGLTKLDQIMHMSWLALRTDRASLPVPSSVSAMKNRLYCVIEAITTDPLTETISRHGNHLVLRCSGSVWDLATSLCRGLPSSDTSEEAFEPSKLDLPFLVFLPASWPLQIEICVGIQLDYIGLPRPTHVFLSRS